MNDGENFNSAIMEKIAQLKKGEIIIFNNIKCIGSDAISRILNPIPIIIGNELK